jgi:hypothetical protein
VDLVEQDEELADDTDFENEPNDLFGEIIGSVDQYFLESGYDMFGYTSADPSAILAPIPIKLGKQ